MSRRGYSRRGISIPSKYILLALSVLCVFLMLISFSMDFASGPLEGVAGVILVPFQKGIATAGSWISDKSDNFNDIEELQTENEKLKIIYFNNNGYHSIRQTQTNLFNPPIVGVCDGNGLSFPDASRIAYAYDIPYVKIDKIDEVAEKLQEVMSIDGPVFCEVVVDDKQNFEPKLSSKVLPDGRIVSPELDDMFPFLDREEYEKAHF